MEFSLQEMGRVRVFATTPNRHPPSRCSPRSSSVSLRNSTTSAESRHVQAPCESLPELLVPPFPPRRWFPVSPAYSLSAANRCPELPSQSRERYRNRPP